MTIPKELNKEDENDLKRYYEALEEYNKNHKTYTIEEVKKDLELK